MAYTRMIIHATGNLLDAPAEALVNPVNTVGVMGKGLALQFKRAYPAAFSAYRALCETGNLHIGQMHVFDRGAFFDFPRYIINFPTKRHWRNLSRLDDIEAGLPALIAAVRYNNIRSIAIPALGCGEGSLAWGAVCPLIEAAFAELPEVRVLLYPPKERYASAVH